MNDINFINLKKDEFIKWFTAVRVASKYTETHKGFILALENELIRANYFHMMLAPLPTVIMLPCRIIDELTLEDYFYYKKDALKMDTYRQWLMEMMLSPSYQNKILETAANLSKTSKDKTK